MNDIKVRKLTQDDWEMYKSLRLNSLKESPDSFGSTFERECSFQDAEWIARLNYENRPEKCVLIVAEKNNIPLGLICGFIHAEDDNTGYVYQMWVAPDARGSGIGKSLLNYIIHWGSDMRLQKLSLTVTKKYVPAIKLYIALGFIRDGELDKLRPGTELKSQSMSLSIQSQNA